MEVKGSAGPWDATFHIATNELKTCDGMAECFTKKEKDRHPFAYMICVIENLANVEQAGFAAVINWTEDDKALLLTADTYKATLNSGKS